MKEFGQGTLLQIAAELLNDRLPGAREAARNIINAIHNGFSKENDTKEEEDGEKTTSEPPIAAQSVAKIVSQ